MSVFNNILLVLYPCLWKNVLKTGQWLQVYAVNFFFMYRILILGIGLLHILSANVHRLVNQSDYCWELSPHTYFLTPGQRPQMPLTNLLIINKTGKNVSNM